MATPSIPPSIPEEGEQLDASGGRRATRNNRGMADGQGKSPLGKSPQGKSPQGKSPQGKSPQGKSPQGKSPQGKSPQERSPQGKSPQTLGCVAPPGQPGLRRRGRPPPGDERATVAYPSEWAGVQTEHPHRHHAQEERPAGGSVQEEQRHVLLHGVGQSPPQLG